MKLSTISQTIYPFIRPFLSITLTDTFLTSLVKGRRSLCIIAPPKTGSTWLSVMLEALTGWPTRLAASAYCYREQELSVRHLVTKNARESVVFSHVHVRYSGYTEKLIRATDLKCVLLVRNLTDSIVSLLDHCNKYSLKMSMFFMTDDYWKKLDHESRLNAIITLAVPWYFNFYAGWLSNINRLKDNVLMIHYEDLLANPEKSILNIANTFQLPIRLSPDRVKLASSKQNTLKNAAVVGRGSELPLWAISKINEMASFYPTGMFDMIGVESAKYIKKP